MAAVVAQPGFQTSSGASILVTGSSGLVGARLVEMLLERGAKKLVCFDVAPPDQTLQKRFKTTVEKAKEKFQYDCAFDIRSGSDGDLTIKKSILDACNGIDIVYHIGALVGPFHDRDKCMAVNYAGTCNIIDACKEQGVKKLVFSSSPSTRFRGGDITGQREEELPMPQKFLATYAESKAAAERAVSNACCDELLTISVAPHQVYGPHDKLFLPSLLETHGNGRLRVFGAGKNLISVCYVDNYCHGLMCGADALHVGSPALGKFYIITDGEPVMFWKMINEAGMAMGFTDLFSKFHLPVPFLMFLAYCANLIGFLLNKKLKLNPFNVKMLTIHRYFSIENAKKDLKYTPLFEYKDAWKSTIQWFKINWLPGYLNKNNSRKED